MKNIIKYKNEYLDIMEKGLFTEVLTFIIVAISALVLAGFYYTQAGMRGTEVSDTLTEREMRKTANNVIHVLYNNEVPNLQRSYMKAMVDSLGAERRKSVHYGASVGGFHVDEEMIEPMMDGYFGEGRWKLMVKFESVNATYGSDIEERYVYRTQVPESYRNYGEVLLYVR